MRRARNDTLIRTVALTAAVLALAVAAPRARAAAYAVEMLVFENTAGDPADDEIWRPELPGESPSTVTGLPGDIAFVSLQALADEAASIERSSAYRLLDQLAWEQALSPRRSAPVVPIGVPQVGAAAGTARRIERLSGTARVYGATYLFVELDLSYRASATAGGASDGYMPAVRYRISERRRIKLNEVHYFDHPRFGALVQVRPIR